MTVRRKSSCTADVELSVSRINRLLRPFRNKCAILASATSRPSGSTVPITYGSNSSLSLENRAPPPLDVLHDPKFVISRAHQESRSLDTLARQIYAVTNTYRNVVQAALSGRVDGTRRDVLALTDICAALIGRNIKGEVAGCLATLEGERDEDDAKETALVDELYESVPARFRSWTLIAHATSEIVDTCPSHPMLLLSLLGVTLSHGLYAESKTFLRLFLTTLIRPHRRHGNVPPPIAHPMHPSYLVELCNEWTRMAPEHRAAPFSHRSFAAITLEVLMEHGSAAAWTCKSITRLVQLLRTSDFECFLTFLHGLIEILAARPQLWRVDGRGEDRSLLARLAKWTGVITSDFFSSQVGPGDGERSGGAHAHEFWSIVEILASAYDTGLHLVAINDDGEEDTRDPQAALVCVATHCLSATSTRSSPLFSTISSSRRHAILSVLHDISPSSTTYDALADLPLARLRIIASALRAHNLNSLERALWTCAVEHASSTSPVVDPALLAALEDAVDWEEEEMVVGPVRKAPAPAMSMRSPPRKRARRQMTVPRRVSHPRLISPSPSPSPSPSFSSSSREYQWRRLRLCRRHLRGRSRGLRSLWR
ncbi:hypothetical protein BGY98DRAFT_383693 [Russula aff. rugulosa BPL654]|nr:hypothetical protein BGY98DRAFT_383693 [Russula aff. rugulosa BPL654]